MNEIEKHLYNLLAILNRDGGQYVSEHGLDAAVENAKKNYYDKVKRIDELELAISDCGSRSCEIDHRKLGIK